MQLLEVNTPDLRRKWLALPDRFYGHLPQYIPHLRQDVEKVFDPEKNKTFRFGEAIRWLLVNDGGKAIGRVAAFTNKQYINPHKFPVGGMGFFECIEDQAAANMLFDACKAWLLERGMKGMDGPINFGERNMFWGVLSDNFESNTTYGMGYNHPYYFRLFEGYGFKLFYNQLLYLRSIDRPAEDIYMRKASILASQHNIRVSTVKGYSMDRIIDDFLVVYNDAWAGYGGFKTMKRAQVEKVIKAMKPVMDPRVAMFAYDGDQPVGFLICIPELNQWFKYVHGNLNWWGKLKFIVVKQFVKPKLLYGQIFGVVRKWQGKGVEAAMVKFASDTIYEQRMYETLIMPWIGDFNPKMVSVADNIGATVYRKYAVLRCIFDPGIPFERHPDVNVNRKKDAPQDSAPAAEGGE